MKTSENGGARGYDANKQINGRKRHLLVDTQGFVLRGIVHPAATQDRDGLAPLLARIRRRFPLRWHLRAIDPLRGPDRRRWRRWRRLVFADGGDQGEVAAAAARHERLVLAIVKRSDQVKGFVLLPKRLSAPLTSLRGIGQSPMIVERTFAWLGRNRRLARNVEQLVDTSSAHLDFAATRLLTRRLATS